MTLMRVEQSQPSNVRCGEKTTRQIRCGSRRVARSFRLSGSLCVLLLLVFLCGALVPGERWGAHAVVVAPSSSPVPSANTNTAQSFDLTPEVRVAITTETFSMCFFDRALSESHGPILCTTPQESIKAGEWVGVNLQKYIYEGYSLRVGDWIWSSHSQGLSGPISYDNTTSSDGTLGRLSFTVQLLKEPIFPFGLGKDPNESTNTRGYGRKDLRLSDKEKNGNENDQEEQAQQFSSKGRHHVLAQVELGRANGGFDGAISIKIKTTVGNRVKLGTLASDSHWKVEGEDLTRSPLIRAQKEKLFGLGERYGPSNQRGRKLYCWTEDGGWSLGPIKRIPKGPDTTYMPVPFMLSSRGHGLWINTTRRSDWDLDSEGKGYYSFKVEGQELEMVLISGRTPARSLEIFTQLTGRSLIPPPFQFGPWNNFINEFNHSTLAVKQAEIFVDLDIPSSVTDFAIHYLPGGPDFTPQSLREITGTFESFGIAPLCYFNSMIDEGYQQIYQYSEENGLFIKNKHGKTWHFYYKGANYQPFNVGLLDFTNPKSAHLFKQLMRNATEVGFRGFMYDYGEYVDPDMQFHDGSTGDRTHNAYPLQYQSVAFDLFTKEMNGKGGSTFRGPDYAPPYIYYVRSGYAGSAGKTWAAWTGDPTSDWDAESGLPAQVKGMLSAGLSGMPFIGSDIGGFVWVKPPSLELWVRWVQLGSVSGIMRMQTGGTSLLGYEKTHIHDSWLGTSIYRRYAKFRTSLFPYLYTAAHESRRVGLPLMRHHLLTFPYDQAALDQEYQWMLGPSLLCAPVLHQGKATQNVYLPSRHGNSNLDSNSSKWYDLMSRLVYDESDGRHRIFGGSPLLEGGQSVAVEAALEKLPMFVAAGSIIATLDPAVDTLSAAASDPRVTTMAQRSHLLNLWLFPDENYQAEGKTWDGAELAMSLLHPSSPLVSPAEGEVASPSKFFTLSGQDTQNRTFLVQVVAGDMHVGLIYVTAPAGGPKTALPKLRSWDQLARACGEEERLSWAEDGAQKTIWICFQPSVAASLTLVQQSPRLTDQHAS